MFQYTTIHRLRQQGFKSKDLPEAEALRLIQDSSALITDVLGQWFVPHRTQKRLDGHGSSIAYFPNRIPFLEVVTLGEFYTANVTGRDLPRRIDILIGSGDRTIYNADEFILKGRFIELLYSNFYAGRGNVDVDSYTGFLDWFGVDSRNINIPMNLQAVATTEVKHNDTEITCDSVDGFNDRDVILLETNDTARTLLATTIVNQIDRTNKKLLCDKIKTLNEAAVPIGSRVLTFGAVPRLIERATILLIKKLSAKIGTDEYDEAMFCSKVKSEKTDRYSYTLYGAKDGGGIGLTGDSIVDSQLDKFSEPFFVDFA